MRDYYSEYCDMSQIPIEYRGILFEAISNTVSYQAYAVKCYMDEILNELFAPMLRWLGRIYKKYNGKK